MQSDGRRKRPAAAGAQEDQGDAAGEPALELAHAFTFKRPFRHQKYHPVDRRKFVKINNNNNYGQGAQIESHYHNQTTTDCDAARVGADNYDDQTKKTFGSGTLQFRSKINHNQFSWTAAAVKSSEVAKISARRPNKYKYVAAGLVRQQEDQKEPEEN